MFANAAERLEVLRRLGWPEASMMAGGTDKLNAVVTEVVRWNHERPKPKLRHYVIRAYRRVVLPRKEWRLPWR